MVSNRNGKHDDNLPSTQGIHIPGGAKKGGSGEQGVPSSSSNISELIHGLEWDAYYALLKAFFAQSKVFTLEKEELMSSLKRELGIGDEQHKQMLKIIRDDKTLAQVLTSRHMGKDPNMPPPSPPNLVIFQSRKKQKVSHASPPAPLLKPPLHCNIVTSISSRQGLPMRKAYLKTSVKDEAKSQVVSKGLGKGTPRSTVERGGKRVGGPTPRSQLKSACPSASESWVGRSLRIRWFEDNILYKALIVGYDKEAKLHRVAYDSGTEDETLEWIDLTKLEDNDIQWLDNAIDPVSQDGEGYDPLGFPVEQKKEGGFRLSMEKSKGRDEGKRPSDKSLQALVEVDNNGTQVKYLEVTRFVKEIDALEHEKDLKKLEDCKQMVNEYEEMLKKALAMVTNFSIDGESKQDDDSATDGDSSTDDDSTIDGDSNMDDESSTDGDSNTDDDSSDDGDSSGSEVNYCRTSNAQLDHVEDNGDNDDYIEID